MTAITSLNLKSFTMDYYQIPKISNSDLGIARNIILGKPQPKRPEKAFSFGTAFHEALLEPEKFNLESYFDKGIDIALLQRTVQRAKENEVIQRLIQKGKCEQVVEWTHKQTGVECKSKLDVIEGKKHLIVTDLKTTSAKTQEDFEKDFVFYEYNRQASFYMQAIGAHEFFSVGISKTSNNIFIVRKFSTDFDIQIASQKIKGLLQQIKEKNLFDEIFRLRATH